MSVGLFGKVPILPDFVRFNAGSQAARAWDEWMNLSLVELRRAGGQQWEAGFDGFPPLHFIGRPTGDNRQVLAGHMRPSRDASGRRYPLTVFCELQLDRHGRGVQVLPFALESFMDAATKMADTCATCVPDGAILSAMASLVPESAVESTQRAMTDRLRAVTMESLWCSLLGNFDDPRKYLCIKNLFAILAPMRGHDPQRLSMALRFPGILTKSDVSPSLAAAIWMSLSRAVIGEESLSSAWLFWANSVISARNGMYLFFRTPAPGMLSSMLNSEKVSDSIWDIESMGAVRINEARDSLGPAIAGVLDTPRFSVLEFIQRV